MNQISARVRARVRGCWLNYQLSNFQDVMIDDAMDHAVGRLMQKCVQKFKHVDRTNN